MVKVLDNNHGIDLRPSYTDPSKLVYVPWYIHILRGGVSRYGYETCYYTRCGGWERVEFSSWLGAYDYIARSRNLPTHRHVMSTYVEEAKSLGISLDPSKPIPTVGEYLKTRKCESCGVKQAEVVKNAMFMCGDCEDPYYHPSNSIGGSQYEWDV